MTDRSKAFEIVGSSSRWLLNRTFLVKFSIKKLTRSDSRKRNWVLSRTACLGNDIFAASTLAATKPRVNLQKLRIDQLEALIDGEQPRPITFKLNRILNHKYVFPLILQQTKNSWLQAEAPFCIILDSFSDLTDQEFYHPDGTRFFAAYSDVSIAESKNAGFASLGLLDLDDYEMRLKNVITKLRQHYKQTIPVVYIHFPSQLESRENFINRAKVLVTGALRVESELENFFPIEADPALVRRADDGLDAFPYHYHPDVTNDLLRKLERLLKNELRK